MNKSAEWRQLPVSWYTLFSCDGGDSWHFCTDVCLSKWVHTRLGMPPVGFIQFKQPMTKEQITQSLVNNLCNRLIMDSPMPFTITDSNGEFVVIEGKTYKILEHDDSAPTKMRRVIFQEIGRGKGECVIWSNGCVSVDPQRGCEWFYDNWEQFISRHPTTAITWIDREVSE